jgi:hypothetical protein
MTEPTADLQFEHATYEQGASSVACGMCNRPVRGEYWQWLGRVVCEGCRERVSLMDANARAPATFIRAALLGGATALGCGVAYAIIAGATNTRMALVTIGIAYVVGTVIRKATANVGGLRFQVLAVALTYAASTMGYAPALWQGMNASPKHDAHAQVAGDPTTDVPGAPVTDSPRSSHDSQASPVAMVKAAAYLFGILLVVPFITAKSSPLGLVIIGIGLWEAWRRTRGLPMVVTGPYRVGNPPPAAAS